MKKNYIIFLSTQNAIKQITVAAEYYELESDRLVFFEKRKDDDGHLRNQEVANFPVDISSVVDPLNFIN